MNKENYSKFKNKFSGIKAIEFKLIPQQTTLNNIIDNHFIELGNEFKENISLAKKIIQVIFSYKINETLKINTVPTVLLDEYEKSLLGADSIAGKKAREKIVKHLNEIFNSYKEEFKIANIIEKYSEEIPNNILTLLKENAKTETITNPSEVLGYFYNKTSSFTNYENHLKAIIITVDEKVNSVANRYIENFERFMANKRMYQQMQRFTLLDDYNEYIEQFLSYNGNTEPYDHYFTNEYYGKCLSQNRINEFNTLISGVIIDQDESIPGLNVVCNEYWNKNKEKMSSEEFSIFQKMKFSKLHSQILQEKYKHFTIEKIQSREELFSIMKDTYFVKDNNLYFVEEKESNNITIKMNELSAMIKNNMGNIYITTDGLRNISNKLFYNWNTIETAISEQVDREYKIEGKKIAKKQLEMKVLTQEL